MCEFISWIEYRGEVLYLTDEDLDTKKGKELLDYIQNPDDIKGHGAVRYFYDIPQGQGTDREVIDLSSSDKLPKEIVKAVKECRMSAIGYSETLLNKKGLKEYEAVEQTAWKEYEAIKQTALKEYEAIKQTAWEKYIAIQQPAWKEYLAIEQPAKKEYLAIEQPALKKYLAIQQPAFWKVFKDKKNRQKAWR